MSTRGYSHETLAAVMAEKWVVGSLMSDPGRMTEIQARLRPGDFSNLPCRLIFTGQLHLWKRSIPITLPALHEHLKSTSTLSAAGGIDSISALALDQYNPAFLTHYARIVADTSTVRDYVALSGQTAKDAHEVRGYDHADVCEYLIDSQNRIKEIVDRATASMACKTLADAADRVRLEASKPKEVTRLLKLGLIDLDMMGDLLRPGRLIVVGARPGDGKSTMLLHICLQAIKTEFNPLLVSLEMTEEEIVERVVAHTTGELRPSGGYTDKAFRFVSSDEASRRLRVRDLPQISIDELRVMAKDAHRRGEMDVLVVDYLQLVRGRSAENRQQEVASIARGLKTIAMDLGIPVVAAAQLNRTATVGEEPGISQLRESGDIEAACDVAMLLWTKDDGSGHMRVRVAKHRGGATGRSLLAWDRGTYRLRDAVPPSQDLMSASLSSWTN